MGGSGDPVFGGALRGPDDSISGWAAQRTVRRTTSLVRHSLAGTHIIEDDRRSSAGSSFAQPSEGGLGISSAHHDHSGRR